RYGGNDNCRMAQTSNVNGRLRPDDGHCPGCAEQPRPGLEGGGAAGVAAGGGDDGRGGAALRLSCGQGTGGRMGAACRVDVWVANPPKPPAAQNTRPSSRRSCSQRSGVVNSLASIPTVFAPSMLS